MHRITTRTASTLAVLVTLAAATACGSGGSTANQPPATRRPASANPSTPAAISTATCDTGAWQSAPLAGQERDTARGATLLTAVRAAQHPECGYERIVLDIAGALPGYRIRYVSKVRADPSDRLIRLPGSHFLLITLHPADMHTNAGVPTMTDAVRSPGYPMLAGWAPAGDFERYVTIAVGLSAETRIRVGELAGRLYIDFKS